MGTFQSAFRRWSSVTLISVICVQFVVHPAHSQSKPNVVSNTKSNVEQTRQNEKPLKATRLTDDQKRAFNRAFLDSVVREYLAVGNLERWKKTYLARLKSEDRKSIEPFLKSMQALPKLVRDGDKLIFSADKKNYAVEWPDVTEPKFKVAGHKFEYDPRKPLKEQIGLLVRKIEISGKSALFELALPEARAEAITATAIIVIVVTTIITNLIASSVGPTFSGIGKEINAGICKLARWFGAKSANWQICADWAAAEKARAGRAGPKLDAIANLIASDSGNVAAKWDVRELECPRTFDGATELVYAAEMGGLECRNQKKAAKRSDKECWFGVRATLGPHGNPRTMVMAPHGVDASKLDLTKPEDAQKIIVNFKFNESREMTGIQVPNPEYNPADPLSKPLLDLSWNPNLQLTPEQQGQLRLSEDMLTFTNSRLTKCSIENVQAEVEQGNDPGSPGTAVHGVEPVPAPAPASGKVIK